MAVNEHGQAVSENFSSARNRVKHLSILKGLLKGITADRVITKNDVIYLNAWLREHDSLAEIQTCRLLDGVLGDALGSNNFNAEVSTLLVKFDSFIDELILDDFNLIDISLGFVAGICANNQINDKEVAQLKTFLNSDCLLRESWPFNEVFQFISNKKLNKNKLLILLNGITGNRFFETGSAETLAISLPFDGCNIKSFKGSLICFTGKFSFGNRKECEEVAIANQADVHTKVVKGLDYLVIGENSSRDWIFGSYGRKIQKAISFKNKGERIKIISEACFFENAKVPKNLKQRED